MSIFFPGAINLSNPRIGYANKLLDATITVTSEAAGFEKENLFDGRITTFWKPTSSGTKYITADFGVATFMTFCGLYAHNVGINGDGVLTVQYSTDNSTWHTVDTVAPAGTEAIYLTFDGVLARYWRLKIEAPTHAPLIGVLYMGEDFVCERGARVSFSQPTMARATKITNMRAQGGAFLGRSVVYQGSTISFAQNPTTIAFMYDHWQPFVLVAELKPFFLQWAPSDYPLEAAFCLAESFSNPTFSHHRYMGASFKAACWTE